MECNIHFIIQILYFLKSKVYHGEGTSKGKIHSLLSIGLCMNKKTYITKMVLLNSLNALIDYDIWLNKLRHEKSMTSSNTKIKV